MNLLLLPSIFRSLIFFMSDGELMDAGLAMAIVRPNSVG